MAAKKRAGSWPKPRLTRGGKQAPEYVNDAPRALQALALTQVPRAIHGPAMRGAFARGWCDGVRGEKADRNPYQRGGSGWQHGMAGEYAHGWRCGKQVLRVDTDSEGMTQAQYERYAELRTRAMACLSGEIVSPRRAVKRART